MRQWARCRITSLKRRRKYLRRGDAISQEGARLLQDPFVIEKRAMNLLELKTPTPHKQESEE